MLPVIRCYPSMTCASRINKIKAIFKTKFVSFKEHKFSNNFLTACCPKWSSCGTGMNSISV